MIRSIHLTENGTIKTTLSAADIGAALGGKGKLWVAFTEATPQEAAWLNDVFHFHPLTIEDCVHAVLRPRVDVYEDYLFLIVHGPEPDAARAAGVKTLEMDAYLGANSNRTNDIVKTLTMIATIVMPMTLITGIYGMNFDLMPELHWHYGYPFALGLMILIGIGMALFFRSRKWM